MGALPEHFNPDTYIVIDKITGEELNVDIFIKQGSKDYWEKVYAATLAEYIEVGGNANTRLLAYLIKHKTSKNLINGTILSIAKEADVGHMTVSRIFKILMDKELLKKIRNGCYFLSPKLLRHGSKTQGAMLLRLWED